MAAVQIYRRDRMPGSPITVVLVDPQQLFLELLAERVARDPDFEVLGTATDSDTGFELITRVTPDIALIDIDLPGRGVFVIAEELRAADQATRIVIVSQYVADVFIDQALRVNAGAYLDKRQSAQELFQALREVHDGEQVFCTAVKGRLHHDTKAGVLTSKTKNCLSGLTCRQISLLRQLAKGIGVKAVAEQMNQTERSIESQKYRIMRQLGIRDRVDLARFAIREGLTIP